MRDKFKFTPNAVNENFTKVSNKMAGSNKRVKTDIE